jgi:hypothetical protein
MNISIPTIPGNDSRPRPRPEVTERGNDARVYFLLEFCSAPKLGNDAHSASEDALKIQQCVPGTHGLRGSYDHNNE